MTKTMFGDRSFARSFASIAKGNFRRGVRERNRTILRFESAWICSARERM